MNSDPIANSTDPAQSDIQQTLDKAINQLVSNPSTSTNSRISDTDSPLDPNTYATPTIPPPNLNLTASVNPAIPGPLPTSSVEVLPTDLPPDIATQIQEDPLIDRPTSSSIFHQSWFIYPLLILGFLFGFFSFFIIRRFL